MPDGSFDERMEYLGDQVGRGEITAGCIVNQPYAQDQHETLHYRHRAGRARFLGGPLIENVVDTMQYIARHVITPEGSDLEDAMIEVADTMAYDYVAEQAPIDTARLRTSGSPWVTENGVEVYRVAPFSPRDEDEQPRNGGTR